MNTIRETADNYERDRVDHAHWLAEVERLQRDHRRALAVLARAEALIHEGDLEVRSLVRAIEDHERSLVAGDGARPGHHAAVAEALEQLRDYEAEWTTELSRLLALIAASPQG